MAFGCVAYLAAAREAVDVGQFTIYGPNWDGSDGAGIPCTYDRWRLGPFFVTRERSVADFARGPHGADGAPLQAPPYELPCSTDLPRRYLWRAACYGTNAKLGQQIACIDSLGNTRTFAYLASGLLQSGQDALGCMLAPGVSFRPPIAYNRGRSFCWQGERRPAQEPVLFARLTSGS
jgi:hypothetical protein